MRTKTSYIGISNRIPYEVLESSFYFYFKEGHLNKELYLEHILQFTKGLNRANKVLTHLTAVIKRNDSIINTLKSKLKSDDFFNLPENDRKVLIICLFSLTFPISYEILSVFATGFKVQPTLNKQLILQKIGAIYGGNRAMHIAVDETIALFLECNLIKREKIGIYSFGQTLPVYNSFINELVIYTDIKLSNSKTITLSDLTYKPWFSYFELSVAPPTNYNTLLIFKDGIVGGGYLTI